MNKLLIAGLAFFVLLFASATAQDAIITGVGQGFKSVLESQTIVSDKTSYTAGETAYLKFYQNLNANCDALQLNYELLDPNGDVKSSAVSNIGKAGYMSVFAQVQQKIGLTYAKGEYTAVAKWVCTIGSSTKQLGVDGYFDGNSVSEKLRFDVAGFLAIPIEPACSLVCSPGSELINPDLANCACQPTYKLGNGYCELGEPVVAADCIAEVSCPSGQVLSGGVCVNPCSIVTCQSGGIPVDSGETIVLRQPTPLLGGGFMSIVILAGVSLLGYVILKKYTPIGRVLP